MLKTLLVADDSTGANASAILLKQLDFTTISLIDYSLAKPTNKYDSIAISTDSRAVSDVEAHRRVKLVLDKFTKFESLIINKRIDSTLRGNLGAELNAFKENYPEYKIIIVPAFPKSGRVCRNGKVYVNDVLLEKTDVAKDPKMPLTTSDVNALFKKQFKGSLTNVYQTENLSNETLRKQIIDLLAINDGIIIDAASNEDIDKIAKVISELDYKIITVDPGVFTYYYTKYHLLNKALSKNRYVYVIGSITDTTYKQLLRANQNESFSLIYVDANELLEKNYKKEINKAIESALKAEHPNILITTTNLENRKNLDLNLVGQKLNLDVEQVSKIINKNLGLILLNLLNKIADIRSVVLSGGDTTLSFLKEVGAEGIELTKEIIPLCVYGKIVGGDYDGFAIVTKGGMIGSEDTYLTIDKFLKEENEYVK